VINIEEKIPVRNVLICSGKNSNINYPFLPRIPKTVLYMNLETKRSRGRPRNKWLDEVREDGRIVGGEEWHEKVYNREEWKKLLRTARNCHILHMAMG
jgi:hypothetical protein